MRIKISQIYLVIRMKYDNKPETSYPKFSTIIYQIKAEIWYDMLGSIIELIYFVLWDFQLVGSDLLQSFKIQVNKSNRILA